MITTSTGSTVELAQDDKGGTVVVLDHPDAPADMRRIEAGRIVFAGQGFQPMPFYPAAWSPEVLRAIADLIEQEASK